MITVVAVLAAVVLLGTHEYLVAIGPRRASGINWLRRMLLLAVVAGSMVIALRPELLQALRSRSAAAPDTLGFAPSGDTFLRAAVVAQQPEHPFPHEGTPEAVRAWQATVVDWVRTQAAYDVRETSAADFTVLSTETVSDVRRTLVSFTSWDGTVIPAFVHEPVSGGRGAGVLVIAGHSAGIKATAGLVDDYQHSVALALARRGYVTLTPELRGFGLLAPNGKPAHEAIARAALMAGTFYKAVVARDLRIALTVLQHWKGVDPARVAVAGASLGGELAAFLAAVDDRPKVIISHSYGGVVGPESSGSVTTDDDPDPLHACHTVPGVNRVLVQEDWFRLIAPRPTQVVRGDRNVSKEASQFENAAATAFARFDARNRFDFGVEPGGHEFFVERAARFLDQWL